MSIKADCHLHSSFSGDSQAPMPEMIDKGISLGLETMCFTEHNDFDYPRTEEGPGTIFLLNTDSYLYDVLRCRAKYEGKMRILFGVELGLQPHLADRNEDFISSYDFDFVIGSTHLCKGMDPYYPEFFEKFSSEEEAVRAYFAETLENLQVHDDYDVLGHLDYIVRVAPTKDKNYSYDKYKDAINICTVVGFPLGYSVTKAKVAEVEEALKDGANEIDMVVNISDVKNHLFDKVEEEIRTLKKACGEHILKVIIETCFLTEEEKIAMCKAVTNAGADYIKTSTGFGTGGATMEDVLLMKANIGPKVKIKAAGGVKTREDLEAFLNAGCDRIGTSSAVGILNGEAAKGY